MNTNTDGVSAMSAELGPVPGRTYTRTQLLTAIEAERHACSIAVWMTLQDALAEDADDKGLDGWMREAEQRVKNRSAKDPDVAAKVVPDVWLLKVRRLVQGFEHVSGIARLWEPDYSSGSERALWSRATEACADVAKLLREADGPNYEMYRRVRAPVWDETAMRACAAAAVLVERERCLRLIDEHVRAADAMDVMRAIKEGKE